MKLKRIERKTLLYKSEVEYADFCLNHVEGCSHGCRYPCYAYNMKRRCGTINKLIFNDYLDEKNSYNSTWTGLYLIKSISHTIYPGSYRQNINFVRNAHLVNTSPNQVNLKTTAPGKFNV